MKELSNISNIKFILNKHGFNFSKSLGQNFLINPTVCPRMAESCNLSEQGGVLEIGPGIGVLTCELAKRASKVVAVELDKRLLPILEETLADFKNINIINSDILKLDLNKFIAEQFDNKEVCVCANLPYYITSPVIMALLEAKIKNIRSIVVMVQKEAAQRICASPGTRNSGAISIAVNYYAKPELLFDVPRGSFIPAPNVDSAVIRLNVRETPPAHINDTELFFKVVKAAFGKRRKTLVNSLSSGLPIVKNKLIDSITETSITVNARAEELTLKQFAELSNKIKDSVDNGK